MSTATAEQTITRGQAATILRSLGYQTNTAGALELAVRSFQQSFRLAGAPLAADNIVGRHTTAALLLADENRRHGRPTLSPHFSHAEFACKCRCTQAGCRGVWVLGQLVDALENLRAKAYGDGLVVVSGYRCPGRNRTIGGASDSQHLHGGGCDVAPRVSWQKVAGWQLFSGIGYSSRGLVVHVDAREFSESNPTGSTRAHPATFRDGA